ncbi:uncharacterized protein LOC134831171 [Culicoides brevitarsis]|uniref:uncharacterized protein LOC134831171 n=1 Tax=Culicoides brevitarsis TaxID=469753 RepID=UPI00307C475C
MMRKINFVGIFFIFVAFLVNFGAGYYFINGTKYFEECDKYAVCNILYDRHWMPDLIENICTCPQGSVCPTMYADPIDEYAMQINSRTQIKFCEPIDKLKKCKRNELAITTKKILYLDHLRSAKAVLHCACDDFSSYWKFNQSYGDYLDNDKALIEIFDDYQCTELKKCEPREFCGYARSDFGFIFHRCSCPLYHKCGYDVEDEDDNADVIELFYNGLGYRARCIPTEEFY